VDGGGGAFSGEAMFADKAPVNAGDTSATVNKRSGVDGFQGVVKMIGGVGLSGKYTAPS
jgi:hypothetical protein